MAIDWDALRKEMYPLKDYEDLCRRWREAFSYAFVGKAYNLTLPDMAAYTQRLLGGDSRQRYGAYTRRLVEALNRLHQAGVQDIHDLVTRVDTAGQFEAFIAHTGLPPEEVIAVLKYLVYWFIPTKKDLSGLVRPASPLEEAIKILRRLGIRSNLDMLQGSLTPAERKAVAEASGLPQTTLEELLHRADFSRMPWASKATISNLVGAGYGSLAALANAQPEQLYQDFYRYGASIGKNLELGNEIENSYRIAQIVPAILET